MVMLICANKFATEKSSVASKLWASKHLWGYNLFAVDGTCIEGGYLFCYLNVILNIIHLTHLWPDS